MKKLLLCAVSLFAATFSNGQYGQNAITLTSDNVQLQSGTIHEHSASINKVKLPSTGSKATWDYSGLSGGSAIVYGYVKNQNKAFSNTAVVDTGIAEQFDSSAGDTYPTNYVYDEDNKGLFFAGYNPPRSATYLQTGYTADSLVIENQVSYPTKRVNVIQFPASNKSSWNSTYTMTTNFLLTLVEIGWTNVKCTEVEYTSTNDNIVGYGDLKIPTKQTYDASNEFDALMDRHSLITIDSLFLGIGGIPTDAFGLSWPLGYPTAQWQIDEYVKNKKYGQSFVDNYVETIESAFGLPAGSISPIDPYGLLLGNGVTQGMPTYTDYSEIFYAANAYRPAITFDFGADNSYSNLASIVYNQDITGDGGGNKGCGRQEANLKPWKCKVPHDKGDRSVETTNNKFGNAGSNTQIGGGSGQSIGLQSDYSASAQVSVYPNPLINSSALNCSMVKNTDATWTISIMNMVGQIIETLPVSAKGALNIPISLNENMKSGLYIVNVSDETGKRVGLNKVNVFSAAN